METSRVSELLKIDDNTSEERSLFRGSGSKHHSGASICDDTKIDPVVEGNYRYKIYHCALDEVTPVQIAERFSNASNVVNAANEKYGADSTYKFGIYF